MRTIAFKIASFSAISACLMVAAPSSSQEVGYADDALYVGIHVVGGSFTRIDDVNIPGAGVELEAETAPGFKTYFGARFHPHLSAEIQLEMIRKAKISIDGGGDIAELDTWALTTNLKAFLLTGRLQPFALVGIGVMEAELEDTTAANVNPSQTDFVSRFGAGLDFHLTEHIVASLGVDYVLPAGDLEDTDYVSFGGGLQYRFW